MYHWEKITTVWKTIDVKRRGYVKISFKWKYKPQKTKQEVLFTSNELNAHEALVLYGEIESNARTVSLEVRDEHGYIVTKKELQKYIEEIEEEVHDIIAYFDGGFDNDRNVGSAGIVIYYQKSGKKYRIRKNESFDYIYSNNEAEYAALWSLIASLEDLGVKNMPVTFTGDSQGVIKQLQGEWPCYDEVLNKWLDRIETGLSRLRIQPTFEIVKRSENKEADQLATQALNDIQINSELKLNE
jgi:ribonuclease HI